MEKSINGLKALGYSIDDYIKMFALSDDEIAMRILDCNPGIVAFAAQMHQQHHPVLASDPLYSQPIATIKTLIAKAQDQLLTDLQENPHRYTVSFNAAQNILADHKKAVEVFLADLPEGLKEGRYATASLPQLPFKNEQFDLALSSHYLFTNESLSFEFHLEAIQEMARVANEVRIFPLVTAKGELSRHIGDIVSRLQMLNLGVEIKGVVFELQHRGNAMLRVWTPSCSVAAHGN
jgi:hypothetical protein